jgi:hypothetical protein
MGYELPLLYGRRPRGANKPSAMSELAPILRTMAADNPIRKEIEQILRTHTRSHFAQNFVHTQRGLTVDQIAQEMRVTPERAADVSTAVRITLDDEQVTNKKWANLQAALLRELLNYPMSPGLRQHVATRLAQLQHIDPSISSEPLGNINLGANARPRPPKPEKPCAKCFQYHVGECP